MELTALGGKEPLDGDTMMLSAAQRVIAKADRANSESLPAACQPSRNNPASARPWSQFADFNSAGGALSCE